MKSTWKRSVFAVLSCIILIAEARAQELDLIGEVGWYRFRRLLNIYAEEVAHNRSQGNSGTLQLQIWATTDPYEGGDLFGHPVGRLRLRPLRPNFAYFDIDYLVRYQAPPAGLYHTTMTLEELTTEGYVIQDYESFPGIVNFGGWGQGAVDLEGTNGDVSFTGPISWRSGDGRANLIVNRIVNERTTRSGALRLRLLAGLAPYDPEQTFDGFELARKQVPRLRPGSQLENLTRNTRFFAPTEGDYHVAMTLEENVRGNWYVVDYVNFPGINLF